VVAWNYVVAQFRASMLLLGDVSRFMGRILVDVQDHLTCLIIHPAIAPDRCGT
jgi:hypothetical protein